MQAWPDQKLPDLRHCALILIDIQRDFTHPQGVMAREGMRVMEPAEREVLLDSNRKLIAAMREAGKPVIYTQVLLRPDHLDSGLTEYRRRDLPPETGFLVDGTWGAEIEDEVKPQPGDFLVVKKGKGAFTDTYLDRLLFNLGVSTCVVTGGSIRGCVPSTVTVGAALGYEIAIVSDATFPAAHPYLESFYHRAHVLNTPEFIRLLNQEPQQQETLSDAGASTALLVVDMQNDFLAGGRHYASLGYGYLEESDRERVIDNVKNLITGMRKRARPVIFLRSAHRPDFLDSAVGALRQQRAAPTEYALPQEGSQGAEFVDGLVPQEGDVVITKPGLGGFTFTPLHRVLRNLGVRNCVLAGGGVASSIDDTLRSGIDLGYRFTLALDALFPPNSPHLPFLDNKANFQTTMEILGSLASKTM